MDIQISQDRERVIFNKKVWHESELILARCFNFTTDPLTGNIDCVIKITSKRALFEFIRISFKNFSESPLEENRRNAFYNELNDIYTSYEAGVLDVMEKRLPYFDKLYSHQKDTIVESFYKQYNFLALDMGLGKTLTSASLSRVHQFKRTVIICPPAVKWNWFRDLCQHFGFNDLYFTIFDSNKSRMIRAFMERFVIINFDIIGNYEKDLLSSPIDHFIIDEAQNLKNTSSLRFKKVKHIIDKNPNAKITFLSGTPIKNRVNDAFAYLKLIKHELGENYTKFLKEYTITRSFNGANKVTGGKNLQDLQIKLSNFMIRKTKEECLDLPAKVFMQYKFELDDYREEYDKVIKDLSEAKEISSLTGNLHSLNKITAMAKMKGIIELAENILDEGRKVVIFGSYNDPIDHLVDYFKERCVKITGSVDAYTRDQHVQRFHNDETCTVFIGNMIAAGVGINLTNASDVIFINFPFVPADLYQSIDRCHRIGQNSSVNVHYTFCEDSIDDYIYEIIMDKEKDINTLIDGGKEVVERGNITEILIKKLLKKDDVTIDTTVPKAKAESPITDKMIADNYAHIEKTREAIKVQTFNSTVEILPVSNPMFELPDFD